MEILLATKNKKKIEEMSRILNGMDIGLFTLEDYPPCPEVEEDRDTFEGNAVKKAMAIAACTGKIAVSDDSGLEVYALNNNPGVRSARYAGDNADDEMNLNKLLDEMRGVPEGQRGGRFVCCIALAFPEGKVVTFSGSVEGIIGRESRGKMGFGYDPIFYPSGYKKTFAEMGPGEKDVLSHRGKALGLFKEYIKKVSNSNI